MNVSHNIISLKRRATMIEKGECYKQGQLVIEGDDGNDPVVAKALAAIAKAKGKN